MLTLMTRRRALALLGAGCATILTQRFPPAFAQHSGAVAFVRQLSEKIIAVINGPGSLAEKRERILPLIDQNVDVDGIGRFCLGRFWRMATPQQQQKFLKLFHRVLLNSITDKLGEYKGVRVSTGASTPRGSGQTAVATVIERPGQPQTNVQWVIGQVGGTPKVQDVIGEGVSLSLTQRQDYSSYLQRNNNNIDALLAAMQRQAARAS
jgi:phospholipid transport system substrate-binding protein